MRNFYTYLLRSDFTFIKRFDEFLQRVALMKVVTEQIFKCRHSKVRFYFFKPTSTTDLWGFGVLGKHFCKAIAVLQ